MFRSSSIPGRIVAFFSFALVSSQDVGETDVDCGGTNCSRCASGRRCVCDTDCSQLGASAFGTIYNTGTDMIVCSNQSLVCTDLRLGVQAYDSSRVPGFVSFSINVDNYPVFRFSGALVNGVSTAIAKTLNGLNLPLVRPSDVIVVAVCCYSR